MIKRKLAISFTVIMLLLLLSSCPLFTSSHEVTVNFNNTKSLEPDALVELNSVVIGKVKSIEPTTQGITIRLHLDPDKAKAVQENAAALIIVENGQARVSILNPSNPARPISAGGSLHGMNSRFELITWQTTQTMNSLQQTFHQTLDSVNDYFESDQWQETKNKTHALLDSLPKETDHNVQRLRTEYDIFLDKLESDSELALDEIEDHYASLAAELEEKKNDFLNNGQKEIAATYDKLLQSLQDTLSRYQTQQRPST